MFKITDQSENMVAEKHRNMLLDLYSHIKTNLNFKEDISELQFVDDKENSNNPLGMTAYYEPKKKIVCLYSSGRHIKDLMRSFAHELIHHNQNCCGKLNGDLSFEDGYAQKDKSMRELEKDAYLNGNMLFRDWEDSQKSKKVNESMKSIKKILRENDCEEDFEEEEPLEESLRDSLKKALVGGLIGTSVAGAGLAAKDCGEKESAEFGEKYNKANAAHAASNAVKRGVFNGDHDQFMDSLDPPIRSIAKGHEQEMKSQLKNENNFKSLSPEESEEIDRDWAENGPSITSKMESTRWAKAIYDKRDGEYLILFFEDGEQIDEDAVYDKNEAREIISNWTGTNPKIPARYNPALKRKNTMAKKKLSLSDTIKEALKESFDDANSPANKRKATMAAEKTRLSSGRKAKIIPNLEWGEYIVKFYIDGKHQVRADYYTDDKEDAKDTAAYFERQGLSEGEKPFDLFDDEDEAAEKPKDFMKNAPPKPNWQEKAEEDDKQFIQRNRGKKNRFDHLQSTKLWEGDDQDPEDDDDLDENDDPKAPNLGLWEDVKVRTDPYKDITLLKSRRKIVTEETAKALGVKWDFNALLEHKEDKKDNKGK